MAAVVQILSYHGAVPSGSDISQLGIAWKRADTDSVDLADGVDRPDAATNYSWRKHTKLNVVSGLAGAIGNIKWFADDAPEDWAHSVEHYVKVSASYVQAGSGDESAQISGTANADTYTSSSPLTVSSGASTITGTGVGTQNYVVQQMGVLSTATAGLKSPRKFTYRYDET